MISSLGATIWHFMKVAKMFRFVPVFSLFVTCQWACLLAEDKARSPAIAVGRPIAETTAVLRERKIAWNPGAWAETAGSPDIAEVDFNLNEEMVARILYSKSRKEVVGIRIMVCPKGEGRRAHRSFRARSILLEDDGSYSVQFLPEPKADKSAPVEKNEFPKSDVSVGKSPWPNGPLRPTTKPPGSFGR